MNIKRFNESKENNIIKEFDDKRTEYNKIQKKVFELIYDYYSLYPDMFWKNYGYDCETIVDAYLYENLLHIKSTSDIFFTLAGKHFKDFLIYVNDPESYKNRNKYNL